MTKTAKPSILNPATLLSGVAGASLVLALALAPVSLDLRGGQLALGSIAAYADEDQDTNSDDVDTNSDDVDTNSDNVDTNSGDVDTNSDDVDTNSDASTAAPMQLSDFISSLQNGNSVVSSEGTATDIELRYADGWEEKIDHGLYVLSDPDGNIIISRAANDADISRLGSAR